MSDYWCELIESSLDEVGITATKEQVAAVAKDCECAEENHRMVEGPPVEVGYNPLKAAKEQYARELQAQQREHTLNVHNMKQDWASARWRLVQTIDELRERLRATA